MQPPCPVQAASTGAPSSSGAPPRGWRLVLKSLAEMHRTRAAPTAAQYSNAVFAFYEAANNQAGHWRACAYFLDLMMRREREEGLDYVRSYWETIRACGRAEEWAWAIELVNDLRARGLQPVTFTFNAALKAQGTNPKRKRWTMAIGILEWMTRISVPRDRVSLNTAIAVCSKKWETALALFELLPEEERDDISYGAAMTSLADCQQWQRSLLLLSQIVARGRGRGNAVPFNFAIRACTRVDRLDLAFNLLQDMARSNAAPDEFTFCDLMVGCSKQTQWESAIGLLSEVQKRPGLRLNGVLYTTAIDSCSRAGKLAWSLHLLREYKDSGLPIAMEAYCAALKVCLQDGQQWQWGHALWTEMREQGIRLNYVGYLTVMSLLHQGKRWDDMVLITKELEGLMPPQVYNMALEAAGHSQQWQLALHLLKRAKTVVKGTLKVNFHHYSSFLQGALESQHLALAEWAYNLILSDGIFKPWKTANFVDLHKMSLPVAVMAVRTALKDIFRNPRTLKIEVGRGLHSSDGVEILRPRVREILAKQFGDGVIREDDHSFIVELKVLKDYLARMQEVSESASAG